MLRLSIFHMNLLMNREQVAWGCYLLTLSWINTITKHIKIWGVRFYIINGSVTRNNIDDILHRGCFIWYEATTGVFIYWKPDQTFVIQRAHHFGINEYNSHLSIEDRQTPGYLLLQEYPESILHNSDLLNLIPYEIDLTSNPFCDT